MLLIGIKHKIELIREYFIFQYQLFYSIASNFSNNIKLNQIRALFVLTLTNSFLLLSILSIYYSMIKQVEKMPGNFIHYFGVAFLVVICNWYVLGHSYSVQHFQKFSSRKIMLFSSILIICILLQILCILLSKTAIKSNRQRFNQTHLTSGRKPIICEHSRLVCEPAAPSFF